MKPVGSQSLLVTRQCLYSTVSRTTSLPIRSLAPATSIQKRGAADVHITRTGKPIIRVQGGRSSLGGHTATVFGATGFLGRYLVNRLARAGCTVVVPFREEQIKRHLKVTGDLGRVVFIVRRSRIPLRIKLIYSQEYDLRNKDSIEASVRHSDIVYNLIGRDYATKNFSFEDVHVWGAQRVAEAVAKYDVDRYVHVSSHSVSKDSPSDFYRTKYRGEQVARELFPETTIVRPAPMFGWEDRLLNVLAGPASFFTSNHLRQSLYPVHAIDVAKGLEKMMYDDSTASQTYELYGPQKFTMHEIADLVSKEVIKKGRHTNIPKALRQPLLEALNKVIWWPVGSGDEVEREFIDQTIDASAKTFKDLGIDPVTMESVMYSYLVIQPALLTLTTL
jgi:NADH dehydrogenase (ubiquinone) 1 alpha subcomplex subunit 9